MTKAEIEFRGEDAYGAVAFLQRARTFLDDARCEALSAEGRQILTHQTVVTACDALLAIRGLFVRGSEGGHRLRLDKAREILGEDGLFDRLDDGRIARNAVSYQALPAPANDVRAMLDAASQLLDLVAQDVEPQLPDRLRGA